MLKERSARTAKYVWHILRGLWPSSPSLLLKQGQHQSAKCSPRRRLPAHNGSASGRSWRSCARRRVRCSGRNIREALRHCDAESLRRAATDHPLGAVQVRSCTWAKTGTHVHEFEAVSL